MQKMFIDTDNLDRTIVDRFSQNDPESVRSRAGTVSYRCKVYLTRLKQGVASHVARRAGIIPAERASTETHKS